MPGAALVQARILAGMRDSIGSWLSGPSAALPEGEQSRYPGERFGLPEAGEGSLASTGRRVGALVIDWLMSMGIAALILSLITLPTWLPWGTLTLIIWAIFSVVGVWLFAFTPGMAWLGMGVVRLDAAVRVGLVRALVRTVLTVFIAPPLIGDVDGRGMHDRATGTAVINTR